MAVKRRVNWVSQQRVDVPDLRSIESAASNDFDELLQTLYLGAGDGYIYRGFDIVMSGLIGGAASGAQMNVDQAAILHPKSKQSGTFLVVPPGTPPQVLNSATNSIVQGAFSPSSLNYVGIEYIRFIDDSTASQVYIWDPTINDETTKVIPRANILIYNIFISTGTWAPNVLPVCIITTDAGNNVIDIEDQRPLMNRLGTAGRTTPNPFYSYPWTAQSEGRTESPFISSSNAINPFHGGDKMLGTEKDWKDAIMSVIKEMKGSAFWYTNGSSSVASLNLTDLFFDSSSGSLLTMRGKFIHSAVTPGMLTWTGQLNLDSIIGNLRYVVPPGSVTLADKQVAYIVLGRDNNFQPTNTFTFTTGSTTVTATSLIAGIFPGDYIVFFSDSIADYAEVSSVSGNTIILTTPYGTAGASPPPGSPNLGTASNYGILAASAITNSVGTSTVNGSLGEYPNGAVTGAFTITGSTDLANAAAHTAQNGALVAYTDLSTRTSTAISPVLDGQTLTAGVYRESSGTFNLATSGPATLTLNGSATDIFVFICSSTLTTGAGGIPTINLTGGALASNVYWAVGSSATINSGFAGTFQGTIIAQASITNTLGGIVNGRLIALTAAVTLSQITTINVPNLVPIGGSETGIALSATGAYTIQVADPANVPTNGNVYWIAKRDDNGSITASIASAPTGAVRVSGVTTFLTTLPHGINAGQGVQVAGVTDTTFNGFYEVLSTPTASSFTVEDPGNDATSGGGTVNGTATIYLRGIGEISQGEVISDDSSQMEAVLQYIGATYAGDTQPQYRSTNYVTQGIDLTDAIGQLDAFAGSANNISNQDRSLKFVLGNPISWNDPNLVLAANAYIQVPGLADARNTILAQTINLAANDDVAWVEINRTAGAPANLTVQTGLISSLVADNNTVIIARKFGSAGSPGGSILGDLVVTGSSREFLVGTTLYVSNGSDDTFKIYDVSTYTPTLLSSTSFAVEGPLLVSGSTAFVAVSGSYIEAIDISVPTVPVILGNINLGFGNNPANMWLVGTRLFIFATSGEMFIVNVATPSSMTLAGANGLFGSSFSGQIVVVANTAYLASGTNGINILDVTTNIPVNHTAYTTGLTAPQGLSTDGTYLYVLDGSNLVVLNISSPYLPVQIGTLALGFSATRISITGTVAYIANFSGNTAAAVDISTPSAPVLLWNTVLGSTVDEVVGNGTVAYAIANTEIYTLQVPTVAGASEVIVGSHSFRLVDGESKENDAGMSIQNRTLLGIASEAQSDPGWNSILGAPLRTIPLDNTPVLSAIASMDKEIDKFFGQMELEPANPISTRIIVTGSAVTMLNGSTRTQKISSLLLSFAGAQIDFATGNIYASDGITPLGVNFTPVVIAANQYQWYSVSIIPNASTSDGQLSGQLLVLPGNGTGTSPALANKAPFPSNGIPLGEVYVQENSGATGILNINWANIDQLGIGSGGGGGTGDTTDFLTRMEIWQDDAPYEFLTPFVFESDIDTDTSVSSAPFDYATNSYKLSTGQSWTSINMLDPEFLAEGVDVVKVAVAVIYNRAAIDPAPTVELSRDGGVNYQAFPVTRTSPSSDSFLGELIIANEPSLSTLATYALGNANSTIDLNATTQTELSQPFVVTSTGVLPQLTLYVNKLGSPAGNLFVSIVRDNGSGSPSIVLSDLLVSSSPISIGGLSVGLNTILVPIPPTGLVAGTYHIVFSTDAAYQASYSVGVNSISLSVNNSAGPTPFLNTYNGTTWVITANTTAVYIAQGRVEDVRIRVTSSITSSQLAAVGLLYAPTLAPLGGVNNREVFVFSGNDNINTFTITTFLPDPNFLMIFETLTGQVFINGGFSLSGNVVTFPPNTFNKPGETITLVAVQPFGASFDSNDNNGALLAANFLGSVDGGIDQSQPGRGIFLRRPDGTLREIAIDNNDNIVVYSV